MSNPTSYCIHGPESLLEAAYKEMQPNKAITHGPCYPLSFRPNAKQLLLSGLGELLVSVFDGPHNGYNDLTLPADWDKLMAILAELKKPKLPEYVRGTKSRVYKVKEASEEGLWVYDCYGKVGHLAAEKTTASITEQEFIEGGLRELAKAGYVKGAVYTHKSTEYKLRIDEAKYHTIGMGVSSGVVMTEVANTGFCFYLTSKAISYPVAQCTIIPAMLTTSQGIPYMLKDGNAVVYGKSGDLISLQGSTIKHLLRQGVTELVTKVGRLTQADLELLTKESCN